MSAPLPARTEAVVIDAYALPDTNALACRVVGNMVPCLLAQRVTESLIGAMEWTHGLTP